MSKPLSDIVEYNPKVTIKRGDLVNYIPMEEIVPNQRYVESTQQRVFSGGSKFENNDIIFARITPCLQNRKIAQYKSQAQNPAAGSTEYFVFRSIPNVSDSSFVYYLLKSDFVVEPAIKSMKGASGRQRAEIQPILDLHLQIPSYDTQIKIGKILSAYDEQIENNNRRISILEEMAQKVYREWFVHFRFPGHENCKMVESEFGTIPQGWEYLDLFECSDIQYGFAFKSKLFCNDSSLHPVVRIRDILGNKTETFSPEMPNQKYLLNEGDILIGMDGIFHMNQWSGGAAYLNQRVVRIRPRCMSTFQLYYYLEPIIKDLETVITGTTVAHLSDVDLKKIKVLVADKDTQIKADSMMHSLLNQKLNLLNKNTILQKTRDLLLPTLINGDIDVSQFDIKIKEE
ncbi:MAG: restriction endonuclease subunit S [Bacillota bacterium]|nr:restriction endonuclease subunit S [Bacillota bacterium]